MARSMTSCRTRAPKYLIIEISTRLPRVPSWSTFHAACSVISRNAEMSAAESAIQFCTVLVDEQAALDGARHGALAEHVEGAMALADPAHAVVQASRSQPCLREREALAALAEQVVE